MACADGRSCGRPRRRHGGGHGRRRRPSLPPGVAHQATGGVGDPRRRRGGHRRARRSRRPARVHAAPPARSRRRVRVRRAGPDRRSRSARRIYSNTGIEMVADAVADGCGHAVRRLRRRGGVRPAGDGQLRAARLGGPRRVGDGRATSPRSSPSCSAPTLLAAATAADAVRPQYPDLAGIVPGVGRFDPCPWGLGVEIRGDQVTALDRRVELDGRRSDTSAAPGR